MDEILIEEKKYISSKQAAKMTGYAKDYIGQLCREGRVPARLIGRSWYVLEAAIQDHKFGNPEEIEPIEKGKKVEESITPPSLVSTWESPRYESSVEELLPSINRIKDASSAEEDDNQTVPQHIQDSWKAWFDRFDHTEEDVEDIADTGDTEDADVRDTANIPEPESEPEIELEEEVKIPIHTIYHLPPEELLPRYSNNVTGPKSELPARSTRRKIGKGIGMTIQIVGAMMALIAMGTAVLGSGYFDEYIVTNSQVRIIAGVALYNK